MRWIKAVIIAFSAYSRLPMPQIKWGDDMDKPAIAFLPLVGAVIGGAVYAWSVLCSILKIGPVLFSAVAVVLPVLISGGIHLDGYCDTSDAAASWQSSERKLDIMKDPHIGAFALIRILTYLLLYFGIVHELCLRGCTEAMFFVYGLSRCLAVWNALTIPNARKEGMLYAFTSKADVYAVKFILTIFTAVFVAGMLLASLPAGVVAVILCIPVTIWYRIMVKKNFGGATGDTTGYYLQIAELALLIGILTGEIVWL